MVATTCAAETTIECKQLSAEIFDRKTGPDDNVLRKVVWLGQQRTL